MTTESENQGPGAGAEETPDELRKRETRLRMEAKTLRTEIDSAYGLVETMFSQVRHLKQRADYYEHEVEKLIEDNRNLRERAHILTLQAERMKYRLAELEALNTRLQSDVARLEQERFERDNKVPGPQL